MNPQNKQSSAAGKISRTDQVTVAGIAGDIAGDVASNSDVERRSVARTHDDMDWESKVMGRIHGRVRDLSSSHAVNSNDVDGVTAQIGWETTVLDVLRRRIERGPV